MKKLNKILDARLFYKTESPIEKIIVNELVNYEGLKFETQYEIKPYRLDVAFLTDKVGLEIDGQNYHFSEEQIERDYLRDEFLVKVKGWKIERVPGWFCYRYPEIAVVKALQHIKGIEKFPRFKWAKSKTISWHIRELYNEGNNTLAERILKKFTNP